jgi:thiamine biosynthesis protein ThiI
VKTAAAIARRADSLALVTGDSLGQVASQTLPNLAAISSDVKLPIFRPLIGLDKYQITELARSIGTYEVSIRPYRDCCSIRSPRPVLNARAEDLLELSRAMELEAAVQEAVDAAQRHVIEPPDRDAWAR